MSENTMDRPIPCPNCGKNLLLDVTTEAYRCSCKAKLVERSMDLIGLCCPRCNSSAPHFMPFFSEQGAVCAIACFSYACQGTTMIFIKNGVLESVEVGHIKRYEDDDPNFKEPA